MTRDEARDYFKDKGLTYDDVLLADLYILQDKIDSKFIRERLDRLLSDRQPYWKRVNNAKRFKGKFTPAFHEEYGHLKSAYMTASGEYFTCREVISFNPDGYIGFCGDADSKNTQPVLEAFVEWCDWLTSRAIGQGQKGE